MPSRRERTPGPREQPLAETSAGHVDSEQTRSEDLAAFEPGVVAHPGDVELIVIAHPDASAVGSRFRVPRKTSVTIGRADTTDLRLSGSTSLSRLHARLRLAGGAVTIEDAGSRNGTYVNGRRIEGPVELQSGDRLQVGGVHCKFLRELDVEAAYHDAMLELAIRDGLTGAYNRRYFDDDLEREIARARRHGHPLALILIDVDHFKVVNDTHGHVVGDQVLRETVTLLRASLRSEQVLARAGGDEFAVLCPETRAAEAGVLAERLRAAVGEHRMQSLATVSGVTCSFGVAELDDRDSAPTDLYARADRALYQSKDGGRNRVSVAADA
jgi:diguanylate cyclase (GGDEF)-like protein